MNKRYAVEVREVVHTTLYVTARTGKEAATMVMNGVRPSGMYRRSIVRVRIDVPWTVAYAENTNKEAR